MSGRGVDITHRFCAIERIYSSHYLFHTSNDMQCIQARPLWEYSIRNEIKKGNNVLVVAHTNSLRALMRVIDGTYLLQKQEYLPEMPARSAKTSTDWSLDSFCFDVPIDISESDIQEVSMPSGIPFVYKVRRLLLALCCDFGNSLVRCPMALHSSKSCPIFIPSLIRKSIPYHQPRAKYHRLILLESSLKSQDCLKRHSSEASCGIAMCPVLSDKRSKQSNALVR